MRRHDPHRRRLFVRWVAIAAAGAAAGAVTLSVAPPPAAAAGPTATCQAQASLTVRPLRVHPGGLVRFTGLIPTSGPRACPAENQAILTSTAELFPPDGFGPAATRDRHGRFTLRYAVPPSVPPGTYSIGLRCGGGNVGVAATLRVV
jgi:hypothetical protein